MPAVDIDDVIRLLGDITDSSEQQGSVLGYFPAMYRLVTLRVKDDVQAGRFDDGPAMSAFVTTFANRYIAAHDAHEAASSPTRPWAPAFAYAPRSRPLVIQHLLLAMNAHINYDLALVAAELSNAANIAATKDDFNRLNVIITSLLDEVQGVLSEFSPALRVVDALGGRHDERVFGWVIEKARAHAWKHAVELVQPGADTAGITAVLEREALVLAGQVTRPHCATMAVVGHAVP